MLMNPGLDINRADQCCDNESYCYVNLSNEPRCCPVGSNCVADSPCKSDYYYCTTTLTSLTTGNSTTQGCCGRRCPQTSYYLCPPDLGGKCCPFDTDCQAGGNCLKKETASTTLPSSSGTLSPTVSETVSVVSTDRLSSGAKAGIGVGIALGTSLLIGLLAWCIILHRRRRRRQARDHNEKFPNPATRAELMGTNAPENVQDTSPEPRRAPQEQQAGQVPDPEPEPAPEPGAGPVEMASDEAAPAEQERQRPASPWETGAHVDSIDGLFELDGLQIHLGEPLTTTTTPEPNVCFPNHLDKM
jgi:hypothetical protein